MTESLRFSHRPNSAHLISWRPWEEAAFRDADASGRLVFLNLTASWCHWCHQMDELTFSDAAVQQVLNDSFVSVRVDADRFPHIQDRYIAGGWPTNAFLTPTGEVIWAGTFVEAAQLLEVSAGVVAAWSEQRTAFETEIERRRRALEAARGRHSAVGLVRREAADDVVTATRAAFDARNGGFGEAPKFPQPDAVELLYTLASNGDAEALSMADQTLDGMLAGELHDRDGGGFFRCALAADWSSPRCEKLLEVNAAMLDAYALGAHVRDRADWREIVEDTIAWVESTLSLPDGLWAGSQFADEEYFGADIGARSGMVAPPVDTTVYTSWNAMWISALAHAGGRFSRPEWIARASSAFDTLLDSMRAESGLLYHYRTEGGVRDVDYLLADIIECARAAVTLYQHTGDATRLAAARQMAQLIEKNFWADDGGFWDRSDALTDIAALRYRERPFDLNARAARLLLDLSFATGERGFRALAERTLALLSPQAGRYGVAGAAFALAVEDFFAVPPSVVIVGAQTETEALRASALALPLPGRRVWTMPEGGRLGTLNIPAQPRPAAYACARHGRSNAVIDGADIAAAVSPLV